MARWKGLRGLFALAFSFVVVIGYILPHILSGEDPVNVSIIGSMVLLVVTLYLTYGWNLKTHAAVLAILAVLGITGLLAWLFINVAFLTGNGDESALYLMQVPGIHVNLRGLLLGGMIIGALGVLEIWWSPRLRPSLNCTRRIHLLALSGFSERLPHRSGPCRLHC